MNGLQKTDRPWDSAGRQIVPSGSQIVRGNDDVLIEAFGPAGVGELLGTLSHEFRTPLASMRNSLALVLNGDAGPLREEQRHFLGMTLRNVDRLDRLAGDLLDSTRAFAGKLPLRLRGVDLGPLLREVVALHRIAADQAGVELDDSALPASFTAQVDSDKVVQMLTNLLGNAIKYCRRGDRIRLRLVSPAEARHHVVLQLAERRGVSLRVFELVVQDDGPGIDRNRLGSAFAPFDRCHDETGGRIPGAGLGLHITRSLAEAHDGALRLTSEPGRGTTASVLLPRDRASGRWMRSLSAPDRKSEIRSK